MKRPSAKYQKVADEIISAVKSFKAGKGMQRRGECTRGKWEDFDFADFIDRRPVEYRAKP